MEYLKNPGKFTRMQAKLPKGVLLTGEHDTHCLDCRRCSSCKLHTARLTL